MGKWFFFALVALATVAPLGAAAETTCRCRADGSFFGLGETTCIWTPEGRKLARCELEQNITSWSVIEDSCPLTLLPRRMTPLPAGWKAPSADHGDVG